MAAIKFDGTLNIPTLVSIIAGLITGVTFIVSTRGDVKTHSAQIAELTQQVGELRRIQMHVSSRQDNQEKAVLETDKKLVTLSKHLKSIKYRQIKILSLLRNYPN
jgi:hypothetical protein